MINQKPKYVPELLLLACVFMTMSGTGIIGYLIYVVLKFKSLFKLNLKILLIFFFIFIILINSSGKFSYINSISIFNDKIYLISKESFFNFNLINIDEVIKNIMENKYGGDAGLISFINNFGLIILLCFFIIFFKDIFNKKALPPLIMLLITSLHYGSIFSIPGQITLAFILTKNYKDKENFKAFNFYRNYKKKINKYFVPLLIIISILITDISQRRIIKQLCDKVSENCYRLNFEYTDIGIYYLF